MDAWERLLAGPSEDFPRGPAPSRGLCWRAGTIALLLAACLIPRVIAAWNWDILWGDSLHYRYASIRLEQGDFEQGFAEFGLNFYPILLIPLRHLGIDWQIAGKWFSVVIATLTVLPLWGWLRRMFDDRLAFIACCIYALHGKLIAISPLIMRDSTFWFLLVLALYYFWRAIGEIRIGLFVAAGLALTLAVYTRTEGWLLLLPLFGWAACRVFSARGQRWRLAAGTLLCVATIPAVVAALNLTWLRESPRWEFFRAAHIQLAVDWWNAATGMHLTAPVPDNLILPSVALPPAAAALDRAPPASEQSAAKSPAEKSAEAPSAKTAPTFPSIFVPEAVPRDVATPSWLLTFKLLERLAKGFTWVGSVLLLIGLVCGWRFLLRPEHLALLALNMCLLVVTRVRYGIAGLDQRYFMPIIIISLPWMALGLERGLAAARRFFERRGKISPRATRLLGGGLIALVVSCSLLDGPISIPAYMIRHAVLGRWIAQHAPPGPALAGNVDEVTLDTFYAKGHVVDTFGPRDCLLTSSPAAVTQRKADVIILWNDGSNSNSDIDSGKYFPTIEKRILSFGYRRIDNKELPAGESELMVFLRE